MKTITFFFFIFSYTLFSQNLVINPSFEYTKRKCNKKISAFDNKVVNWSIPNFGTTDLFSNCSKNHVGTPSNYNGLQEPKEGYNYAGCYFYSKDNKNYREYIQGELKHTLQKNNEYEISFYISLADVSDYAIKHIDFILSNKKLKLSNSESVTVNSSINKRGFIGQLYTIHKDGFYSNKIQWTKVTKKIIANGYENNIIIGNFHKDKKNTKKRIAKKNQKIAYYYIDMIGVKDLDSTNTKVKKNNTFQKIAPKKTKTTPKNKSKSLRIKTNTSHIFKNVIFNFNRHELSNNAKKEIEHVYEYIKSLKDYQIEIYGYTDNQGSRNFNLILSKNRANAVMKYFIELGLEKDRIKSFGYGKTQPLLPNTSDKNRSINRRVEFKILKN